MWNKITNPLSSIKRHITSILGSRTSDSPSCKKILKNINTNIAKSRDTSRGNRGEIEGNPFWAHTSSSESVNKMTELQWYSGKELSVLKAKILRNKTISKFNVNPKIIKKLGSIKFNWINQGDVGGCSFACISNICQLANIFISWDISYLKTSSGFKSVYTNTFECDDEGYNEVPLFAAALSLFCLSPRRYFLSLLRFSRRYRSLPFCLSPRRYSPTFRRSDDRRHIIYTLHTPPTSHHAPKQQSTHG